MLTAADGAAAAAAAGQAVRFWRQQAWRAPQDAVVLNERQQALQQAALDSADANVLRRAASDNCLHNVDVAARAGHRVTHRPCTPIFKISHSKLASSKCTDYDGCHQLGNKVEECEHCKALFWAKTQVRVCSQCKGAFVSRMHSASLMAGQLIRMARAAVCGIVQSQFRGQHCGSGRKRSHQGKHLHLFCVEGSLNIQPKIRQRTINSERWKFAQFLALNGTLEKNQGKEKMPKMCELTPSGHQCRYTLLT